MQHLAFPWNLRAVGTTLMTVHPAPIVAARRFIPPMLRILPVWPGWTLGGLYLVQYGPGSILRYNELIACAGIVWLEGAPHAWVSHAYVDDRVSRDAGREVLGVAKEIADFVRIGEDDGDVVIRQVDRTICRIRHGRPWRLRRGRVGHRRSRPASRIGWRTFSSPAPD